MTLYPNSIDDSTTLPPASGDDATSVNAAIGAIEAIETELGIVPAGVYANVRARLDILEARINNPFAPSPDVTNPFFIGNSGVSIQDGYGDPGVLNILAAPGSLYLRQDGPVPDGVYTFRPDGYWHLVSSLPTGPAGGDLSGNYPNPTVVALQGNAVENIVPTDGYVLTYNAPAMQWQPQAITSGSVTLSGDVTGNATSNHVVKINGTSVPPTPTTDQVLVATGGTSAVWQSLVNAQISNSAAIAYSKLNLTGNIINSDISASAVIAVNKLAPGTSAQILLNNSTPTPTWTTVSGDIVISNTGVVDVTGLLTHALPALSDGYLNWTGSAWALSILPTTFPPSGPAGGDLVGTYPNPKVITLSGTTGSIQAAIASNLIQFPNPGTVLTGTVSVSGVPSGNITDVVTINNGSPSVNATNSGGNFAVLIPGQIIQFSSQPSVNYTILSITNNNTFTLTTNYTGTNSTTASIITFPNIVYGSGTLFTTQVAVGQAVVIGNDPGTSYIVASIQSNTQLTLTNQYANPSATGQTITAVMNITQNAATSNISPSPIVITGQNAFSGASTFTKGGNIALIPGAPTSGTSNGGSVVVYLSPILNGGAPVASPHSGSDGSFIVTNSTLLNPYASTASFSVNPYSNQACRVYIGGSGESYLDSNGSSLFISGMPTRVGNGSDLDMDFCELSVNTTLDNQNIMARTSVQFQSQISNPVISLNAPAQDALINHPLTITGQNAYVNTSFTPTGTVFINNGSMTLNGFNTFFQIQLFAGQTITISAVNYVIGSITTETQLILTTPYAGTTILSPGVSFTATTFNTTGGNVNITSGAKTPSAITGMAGNVNIQTGGTTHLSVTPTTINLITSELNFANTPAIISGTVTITGPSNVPANSVTVSNGSSNVTTSIDFTPYFAAGSVITFASQVGINYVVQSINSSSITLTANFTGANNTTTVNSVLNMISGSGTFFTTQLMAGQSITFGTSGSAYQIFSIQSDTLLTLGQFIMESGPRTGVSVILLPEIVMAAAGSDTPTKSLVIQGESAFPGATTNRTGGNIVLMPGVGNLDANNDGYKGGSLLMYLNNQGPTPTIGTLNGRDATFTIFSGSQTNTQFEPCLSIAPYGSAACRVFFGGGGAYIDGASSIQLVSPSAVQSIVGSAVFTLLDTGPVNSTVSNAQFAAPIVFPPSLNNSIITKIQQQGGLGVTTFFPVKIKGQDANVTYTASANVTHNSPNVVGIGTGFTTQSFPGQTVSFASQPATFYTILSITDNLNLTLTTNYTGTTTTPTVMTLYTSGSPYTDGGALLLQGGAATNNGIDGYRGSVRIQLGGDTAQTLIEATEVLLNQRVVSLCQIGSGLTSTQMPLNSGDGVIYIADGYTIPTVNGTGGTVLYSHSGSLETYGGGYNFNAGATSPTIAQATATSDVSTQTLTISSQAPFVSASTHKSPGNIILHIPAPVVGGTCGKVVVQDDGYGIAFSVQGDGYGVAFSVDTDPNSTVSIGNNAIGATNSNIYWQRYYGTTTSSSSGQLIVDNVHFPNGIFLNNNTVVKLKCTCIGVDESDGYFSSFTLESTFANFGGIVTSSVVPGGVVSDQDYSTGAANVSPIFSVVSNILTITVTPWTSNSIHWSIAVNGFNNTGTS